MFFMNNLKKSIIDFHVHLFPDVFFRAIWQSFRQLYNAKVLYQMYYKECINFLRKQNISSIIFSNYAHKKGIAKILHQWSLKVLNEYQDIYYLAAYHPDDENALNYAQTLLKHPRIIGIKLHFQVQCLYPFDDRLFPLYELVKDRGKILLLHTGTGPIGNDFVGVKNFVKLLKKFPDLPAIIPHMGGLEYKDFIELLDYYPNLYLDTSFCFWPNSPWLFNLDKNYLEKYKDRILYGSDFPNIVLPREDEINYLYKLNLSKEFYQKIFYANAQKLINQML